MELITLLTTYYPELKFMSQTNSIRPANILDNGDRYHHEMRIIYLPDSEKWGNVSLFHSQHTDNKSYIDKELLERFEKDLFIQIAYSKETNGDIVDNNGQRVWSWADIRKQLKPIKNLY